MIDSITLEFLKEHAPCYLYDQATIVQRAQTLHTTFPGFAVLMSIKANPFAPVVRLLAAHDVGADAASLEEVHIASRAGMPACDIYYSAAGKTDSELKKALGHCVLTADSAEEIRRINAICAHENTHVEIGLRVNPNFTMDADTGVTSKFGVCEEDLPRLSEALKTYAHVSIAGLHVHVKSQQLDAHTLGRYYENVFAMAKRIDTLPGFSIQFVNFGGGVGTVYDAAVEKPLEMDVLARYASRVRADNDATLHARLIIESGRYLTCDAGTYYTPVIDVKENRGKRYVIVQNGLNGFLRPVMTRTLNALLPDQTFPVPEPLYTRAHAFEFDVLNDEQTLETYDLVGNLCTAADVLLANAHMKRAHVGDLISVSKAGSYAFALTPVLFSSHPAPGQYLVTPDGLIGA